ncbi:MAG: hypothetical protein QNK29_02685, partial [Desulfobacterales bacterium]|nr:hypothetical protein [Desulfobacterales bacterium]MDX2510916.1 hypothetical protein [Desulfobacterales bacterium]
MTDFIIPAEAPDLVELKTGRLDQFARLTVLSVMKKLKFGRIRMIEDLDQHSFGGDRASELQASIRIQHPRFYSRILFSGSIGAAEA